MFHFLRAKKESPAPPPVIPAPLLPRGPFEPVAYTITEFFLIRSVLMGRGYCEIRGGAAPSLLLRLWDGTFAPVEERPDPFAPLYEGRHNFSFHFSLPAGVTYEQIGQLALVLQYPSSHFIVEKPAGDGQSGDAYYASEAEYWQLVQRSPDARVLEIGSRARSGISRRNLFPASCEYTGLDICDGENVNVVGDAHRMSEFLPNNHFDLAFSISVWEHLQAPWKVSIELNRVLKLGGVAMISSHQSWPSHEEPWDYFRFSDFSWDSLFNADTGFEILTKGTGVKCVMAPARFFPFVAQANLEWHYGYLASRCVVRKTGEAKADWPAPSRDPQSGTYNH